MTWPQQPGGPYRPQQPGGHHHPHPPQQGPPQHQGQQPYPGPPQHQGPPHPAHRSPAHHGPPQRPDRVAVPGLSQGWTRAPGWPLPGEPGTRWLAPDGGAGMYLRRILAFAPALVVFFLLAMILGSIPFESAAEGTGMIGGTLVGLLATAGLACVPLAKVHRMVTRTHVIVSPVGVELRDHLGFQVRLRWQDLTQVGPTVDNTLSARSVEVGPFDVRVQNVQSHGIIGWGERVVPAHVGGGQAALAGQPRHPGTGAELVAISFPAAGPADAGNPLLNEVRRHRSDLFVPGV